MTVVGREPARDRSADTRSSEIEPDASLPDVNVPEVRAHVVAELQPQPDPPAEPVMDPTPEVHRVGQAVAKCERIAAREEGSQPRGASRAEGILAVHREDTHAV